MRNNYISCSLTSGNATKSMLIFAFPMMIGNLFQQFYNIMDTLIVGRFVGPDALAAVGASYTLMIFLTSIILGLCMGSGVLFSIYYGAQKLDLLRKSVFTAFVFIAIVTAVINFIASFWLSPILRLLQIPVEIFSLTKTYMTVILCGMGFTFLYNFAAAALRSIGNSFVPLIFLAIAAILNVGLDLLFVVPFHMGVAGAALATILAQAVSGIGLLLYLLKKSPQICPSRKECRLNKKLFATIANYSLLSSLQQSIMNFGILMVQGLINSFGVTVMAAFAAATKIDTVAYMPLQDFGNAFSTYIAQNYGAKKPQRIQIGINAAFRTVTLFCLLLSAAIVFFAPQLMHIFIDAQETEILQIGAQYLRIEAACYCGIGYLFLLYGFYRGLGRAGMSVVLTVVSLGTRVLIAYTTAKIPSIGFLGIWWSIPIGWVLADLVGWVYYRVRKSQLLFLSETIDPTVIADS